MYKNFEIPILFLTFNRLSLTIQTFNQIRKVKPAKLYISSDGPRDKIESSKVNDVRSYIESQIDWDCKLIKIYHKENLGCKLAVSEAIKTFYDNEEMGIVLEDDCFPSLSFFYYCEELLYFYQDDTRIYSISGYNQQNIWFPESTEGDYFFSKLGNCWGWASWRRCWKDYDIDISDFNEFVYQNGFKNSLGMKLGKIKEKMIRDGVINQKVDSWALQWGYLRHKNSGLTCIPRRSLVKNIGFGDAATHTKEDNPHNVDVHDINFPMRKNSFFVGDESYDELMFRRPSLMKRLLLKLLG
jgi:hypothetical protein